ASEGQRRLPSVGWSPSDDGPHRPGHGTDRRGPLRPRESRPWRRRQHEYAVVDLLIEGGRGHVDTRRRPNQPRDHTEEDPPLGVDGDLIARRPLVPAG